MAQTGTNARTGIDAPESDFPEVQGGGSLMLAWQVKGKKVLVVGGGEVAAGRILNLLNADAVVTCVCPSTGLNAEVKYRVRQRQITHVPRAFRPQDLDDPGLALVLVAIDDPPASTEIWQLCKDKRIPANIADVPPECDFYFGSVHRDGPLQVMVSTNGRGPRLAAKIREYIGKVLPNNAGGAVDKVGELRRRLRVVAPRVEEGPKRMRWMTTLSDKYSFEEICELTEEDMQNLLGFYSAGQVPEMSQLRGLRKVDSVDGISDAFDGSFGFSVGA